MFNLSQDNSKNITGIAYNFLNLPQTIQFGNGSTINYTYGADGTKRKVVHSGSGVNKTTTYCGNVIYENGNLSRILTEEGYITFNGTTPTYHYYLKDHLGNNRVVVDQHGNVEETNHYYPFGGTFAQSGNVQPYKYNGKELDGMFGLNLYDYSARQMEPGLGRFTTMDPLAEKYYSVSPYVYCGNNPVRFVDPDGMDSYEYDIVTRQLTWINDVGGSKVQHVDFVTGDNFLQNIQLNDEYVFVYALSDGFIATNYDANLSANYNVASGYEYSIDDFMMRKELTNSPNPIGTYIYDTERIGMAEPITRRDAENQYGNSLMGLIAWSRIAESALNLNDTNFPGKAKGFKGTKILKQPTTSSNQSTMSSSRNNPWINFLKANKGKYKGKNWRQQALDDYYKLKQ